MELSFVRETPTVINLTAGKTTLSRYVWHADQYPHVTCLLGPGKRNVLEDQPPDHLHHHGVCSSHGVVNDDLDFYLYREKRNLGRIDLVGDLRMATADNTATLSHDSEWIAPGGGVSLTDTRTYRWETLDNGEIYLDTAIDLSPTDTPVTFHPTNDSQDRSPALFHVSHC